MYPIQEKINQIKEIIIDTKERINLKKNVLEKLPIVKNNKATKYKPKPIEKDNFYILKEYIKDKRSKEAKNLENITFKVGEYVVSINEKKEAKVIIGFYTHSDYAFDNTTMVLLKGRDGITYTETLENLKKTQVQVEESIMFKPFQIGAKFMIKDHYKENDEVFTIQEIENEEVKYTKNCIQRYIPIAHVEIVIN